MGAQDRSEQPAPWARGGSMSSAPLPPVDLDFDPVDSTPRRRSPWSPRVRVVTAIGAVALVAAGVALATRSDEPTPAADLALQPTTPPTVETLPNELVDLAPTTIRPRSGSQRLADTEPPRFEVIAVPAELAGLAPTEVVALQSTEGLFEVSLPSGRVRITDLDYFAPQGTRIVVNDAGTLIWPTPEGGSQLIGVDRSIAVTDLSVSAATATADSNSFVVWRAPPLRREVELPAFFTLRTPEETGDVSAGLTVSDAAWLADVTPRALSAPDGGVVVTDTGGSYLLTAEGITRTTRITTGDVVATGRNHLLLRECDQQRECSLASLDRNGARTLWAIDLPAGIDPQQINGLSPSGDALLINGARLSADQPRELQVLELLDARAVPLRATRTFSGTAAWASDSSGVFVADSQLLYLPRSGEEAIVVSPDLPQLRTVGARQPAHSPVCELLEIVLPRFEQMQNSIDDTVAPPGIVVLNRLVDLSPEGLAIAAQPLVTFVGAFVSAETPDSQVVANWPADVRAGLDALVEYAAATC